MGSSCLDFQSRCNRKGSPVTRRLERRDQRPSSPNTVQISVGAAGSGILRAWRSCNAAARICLRGGAPPVRSRRPREGVQEVCGLLPALLSGRVVDRGRRCAPAAASASLQPAGRQTQNVQFPAQATRPCSSTQATSSPRRSLPAWSPKVNGIGPNDASGSPSRCRHILVLGNGQCPSFWSRPGPTSQQRSPLAFGGCSAKSAGSWSLERG